MARIGVENSLTDVQQALQQQGHEVVTWAPNMMHKGAIVVL